MQRHGQQLSRNDAKPVLRRTFMEHVLAVADQVQERVKSIKGEKPRPGTTRWQKEVVNAEFEESYRKNNREIFNPLGNEYGWQFLETVLGFHYLGDGDAITRAHMRALSGMKPTQGCQVRA